MLTHFFVTGTDTDVGKTIVSRALLQALTAQGKSAIGYKPVATESYKTDSGLRNKDALVLQESSSIALPYAAINPFPLLEDEIYSSTDTVIDYTVLSQGLLHLRTQADCVVVEGCGGWRVLMNDLRFYSEWVIQEKLPVMLVVGIKQGCINHALLTAQAIQNDGLPLLGWIANRINPGLAHYAETIDILRQKIAAPLLGEIPYLPRAETRDMTRYIDLSLIN